MLLFSEKYPPTTISGAQTRIMPYTSIGVSDPPFFIDGGTPPVGNERLLLE